MALAFSHNTKKRPTGFLQLGAGGKLKNNFDFGHSSTQKERVLGWERGVPEFLLMLPLIF